MMEIILRQRVEKLGQMGDVVQVKPGYARNFLIPKGIAFRATKDKLQEFEAQRSQLEAHNLKLKKEAEKIAEKMKDLSVVIIRQAGESGHLYGSVRPQDISEALTEQGYRVERTQVQIDTPIKELGISQVKVALHPEVSIFVKVNVALSEEEAKMQEQAALKPKTEEQPEEGLSVSKRKAKEAADQAETQAQLETQENAPQDA